jgi:plasmid stabilization system protein ParE
VRFSDAIQAVIDSIQFAPEAGARSRGGRARFKMAKKFPYAIYYVERPDRITLVAVAHHSRREGYWVRRLENN